MSKNKSKSYSLDFKKQAVRLVIEEGLSIREAAADLGVVVSTLHTWVRRYQNGTWIDNVEMTPSRAPQNQLGKKSSTNLAMKLKIEEQAKQIKQLQSDLKKTTMEREILKKAAAYFASLEK